MSGESPKMMKAGVTIIPCKPIEQHARLVMTWRNDKQTLRMSYHQEPKLWHSFWPEFRDSYFQLPELPPLFACLSGTPFAFVRFQPCASPYGSRNTVDISVNLSPNFRGQGLAPIALRRSLEDLASTSNWEIVLAEVRVENTASHKSFLAAGFTELETALHTVIDTGEVCKIVRYTFELVGLRQKRSSIA